MKITGDDLVQSVNAVQLFFPIGWGMCVCVCVCVCELPQTTELH